GNSDRSKLDAKTAVYYSGQQSGGFEQCNQPNVCCDSGWNGSYHTTPAPSCSGSGCSAALRSLQPQVTWVTWVAGYNGCWKGLSIRNVKNTGGACLLV